MPNEEKNTQTADEESGTPSGGDKPATETPSKINIPGVGEASPEQVKEWKEKADNEAKWRASLDKHGAELNASQRKTEELARDYSSKLSELESLKEQLREPEVDLSTIEDPAERDRAEKRILYNKVERVTRELQKLREDQVAAEAKSQYQKKVTGWTETLNDVVDKYADGLDDEERETLDEKIKAKMGRKNPDQWMPEDFDEAARISKDQILRIRQKSVDNWAAGKKKTAEESKVIKSGGAAAPKKTELNANMSQEERLAAIAKNMEANE